ETDERNPKYRRFLCNHYGILTRFLLKTGDHAAASKIAPEAPALLPNSWEEAFGTVHFLVQCVRLALEDARLAEPQRKVIAQTYTRQVQEHVGEVLKRSKDDPRALDSVAWFLANCVEFRDA